MDRKKLLLAGFVIFSVIGFLDSAYLTLEHYQRGIVPCVIFKGCDTVLTSKYSTLAGFPISLFGSAYYLAVLVGTLIYFDTGREKIMKFTAMLPVLGFMISLGLLFLQLFVIKDICFYCMISLATSTILFVLSIIWINKFKENQVPSQII